MSLSTQCPSLTSPPSKQVKQAPLSPSAPIHPSTPTVIPPILAPEIVGTSKTVYTKPDVSDNGELSVFDILHVFYTHWFLNRDHLIANVLSAQKSDNGHFASCFLTPIIPMLSQQLSPPHLLP